MTREQGTGNREQGTGNREIYLGGVGNGITHYPLPITHYLT